MKWLKFPILLMSIFMVGGLTLAQATDYPKSKHYDGKRFRNLGHIGQKTFGDFVRVLWERNKAPWPAWVENNPTQPPPAKVVGSAIRLTMINHASVLVQTEGFNFITDPIWSERCSPVSFTGPKRHRAPGVSFENLPKIDAILISHNHFDHLDLPTLKRLEQRDKPLVVVGLGTKEFLKSEGLSNVVELDWWGRHRFTEGIDLHFVPAQHWSKRNFFGQDEMLWGGFVIQTPQGKIYFAGDTGYGPHFKEVHKRLGPVDAALLPIGAYKPQWFMTNFHMSPTDAVKAFYDLGSPPSVAIHHGTFPLGQEGINDASDDLLHLKKEEGASLANFKVLNNGEALGVEIKQEASLSKELPESAPLKVVHE
jgi:L-ascorbate metabolism protein UlaG (beta-lactamase superfamily)